MSSLTILRNDIKTWAKRPSMDQAIVDTAIRLAEGRLNKTLRIESMAEERLVGGTEENSIVGVRRFTLPSRTLGVRTVIFYPSGISGTGEYALQYRTPEILASMQFTDGSGPQFYTRKANKITIKGAPLSVTGTLELIVYKSLSLSDSEVTNNILAFYYDTYLYTALEALARYVDDEEAAQKWGNLSRESISMLVDSDAEDRWGGGMKETVVI